jgi:putative copper resistance protein D
MKGIAVDIDMPMTVIRAIHFGATAVTAGTLSFRAVVAEPAFRSAQETGVMIDAQVRRIACVSLAVTVVSGAIWLALQTAAMSGRPFGEAVISGMVITVLDETQFGLVSEIRLGLAILLAVCLAYDRSSAARWLSLGLALSLVAAIAWTGHAASTPDELGDLHLAADALHLCAAAAWIGALVPLALLLDAGRRQRISLSAPLEVDVVKRFSALGIVSVAALIVSGLVNAWILVGSFRGLIMTGYGWLLLLKLAVFAVMIAFAAANRFRLTPQLALQDCKAQGAAHRLLLRNVLVEIALGLVIYGIVSVLGTQHPAIHLVT